MGMQSAICGLIGLALVAGCGSTTGDGDDGHELLELTTGSRQDALYSLGFARALVLGLERREPNAVCEAAHRLGSGSAGITFGEPLATVTAMTRFGEPQPAPSPGATSCQSTGCGYAHHRDSSFYPNWIDGSVAVALESGVKRVTIDLVVHNDSWAVAEVVSVTGRLEVAAGVLNGAVTERTEYVHGTTEHRQVRFDRVSFDEAAGPSDEPASGAISAEWAPADQARKGATISFP